MRAGKGVRLKVEREGHKASWFEGLLYGFGNIREVSSIPLSFLRFAKEAGKSYCW